MLGKSYEEKVPKEIVEAWEGFYILDYRLYKIDRIVRHIAASSSDKFG